MSDDPTREAELSPDHCPNCGRELKFPEDQTEGLCPSCGIFVEVLTPLPKAGSVGLAREHVVAATRRELERMCRERGLAVSGKKADLIARLIEYIDRQGSRPQEGSEKQETDSSSVASGLDDIAKRAELALLFLNLEQVLEEGEASERPTGEGVVPPAEPQTPPIETQSPPPTAEPPPQPTASAEPTPSPETTSREELPPPLFAESSTEEIADVRPDQPEAEAIAPTPEVEPPEPSVEAMAPDETVVAETPPEPEAVGRAEVALETRSRPAASHLRRDRAVFHVGAVLVAIGGAVFLLGSLLHDMFRVPYFGDAYEIFGSLNVAAALMGIILSLAGIGAMAIGARGGVIRPGLAAEA